MTEQTAPQSSEQDRRKQWMSVLATAPEEKLETLWNAYGAAPERNYLRAPETGGVMIRGRQGGNGAPFNLGEITVTRCALSLVDGTVGHGYVQGRNKKHCEIAALVDALMQGDAADAVEAAILAPLREAKEMQKTTRASKAAATKVDFFTMVRGED